MAGKNADMAMSGPKVKESTGYKIFVVINTIIMIAIVFFTLYPFVYLVAQSFSSERAIYAGEVSFFL